MTEPRWRRVRRQRGGPVQRTLYGATVAVLRGGLANALRETDSVCRGWTPRVPARLYMAGGGEQASTTNTATRRGAGC
ncbi:hypothetical protein [Streptomyces sp. NPDC057302]|uniref:hypothetical protein n=1 Tax=Streptomyces sp. NPDC057302 TaxID=3346094 RepID=UPI0036266C0B